MRVVANIKPALLSTHPSFIEAEQKKLFITNPNGTTALHPFWGGLGIHYNGKASIDSLGAHLDFTNIDTINWW